MKIDIIDGDSIIWTCAYHQREINKFNRLPIKSFISDILKNSGVTHYIGYIGGDRTYRKEINPNYKANRPEKPDFMKKHEKVIVDYMVEDLGFEVIDYYETDDICASIHIREDIKTILCSPDKDMKQVPGELYDYKKNKSYFISDLDASYALWKQVLTGDTSDNIKGLNGVGPKTADKILQHSIDIGDVTIGEPLYFKALKEYITRLGEKEGIEQFYKTYKQVKLVTDIKVELPEPKTL